MKHSRNLSYRINQTKPEIKETQSYLLGTHKDLVLGLTHAFLAFL